LLFAAPVQDGGPKLRRLDREARCKTRLATTCLTGEQHDADRLARLVAQPPQARELGIAAYEERAVGAPQRRRDKRKRCLRPQRLGEAPRLVRRADANRLEEPRPQLGEDGQRGRAVTRRSEAPHQCPVWLLRKRLQRRRAP
jgi:hypothetical protein